MTIKQALQWKEGDTKAFSLNFDVIDAAPLKEGTGWKLRKFTIKDAEGTTNTLTAFGSAIEKLEVGGSYEMSKGTRKDYNGNAQLIANDYTQLNRRDNKVFTGENTTLDSETPKSEPQQGIKPIELEESIAKIVECKTELLYAINKKVEQVLKLYENSPNPATCGLFTKLIWEYLEDKK